MQQHSIDPDTAMEHYFNTVMKRYLKNLDPMSLRRRIGKFWEHDFERMTYADVSNAINGVLMVRGEFVVPMNIRTVSPGTKLFRVRHVSKDIVPCNRDCWAPPKEKTPSGRINQEGVPWLYTSLDPSSVFSEMPIPSGKIAMLILYKAIEEIKCSSSEFDDQNKMNMTRRELNRLRLTTNFLRDLLSIEIDKGKEYSYKISQSLVIDLVDYPMCTAVYYPAVNALGYHVAIKGQNQNKVKLSSVKIIDNVSFSNDNKNLNYELLRSYDENLVENTRRTKDKFTLKYICTDRVFP